MGKSIYILGTKALDGVPSQPHTFYIGVVRRRSSRTRRARPWVPGWRQGYSVRLIVDGKTVTQPLTVKMDPRGDGAAVDAAIAEWEKMKAGLR